MGDLFRKVQSGEPFRPSAGLRNAAIDAIAWVKARERGQLSDFHSSFRDYGTILVRNNTGSDRDRFDAVGLGAPVISPDDNETEFQQQVVVQAEAPVFATYYDRWAVLLEPLPAGAVGTAMVYGVCPVKVNILDVTFHRWAGLLASPTAYTLASKGGGIARILWKATEATGYQWCLLALGNLGRTVLEGTLSDYLSTTHSADIVEDETGLSVTVYAPARLNGQINSGKKVRAEWHLMDNRFQVESAEC